MTTTVASKAASATAGSPVLPGTAAFDALLEDLREGASERELNRILPHEQVALLKRARIGALRLPKSHGGGGLSMRELFEAIIALGAADANVTHILRNHFAFVERFAQPAVSGGSDFLLKEVAAGKVFGLASPELTTYNVGRVPLETKLVPSGDGYVVSGTKYYSTGTLYADYVIVRVQDETDRYASLFLPTDREGIFRDDDWDGIGQRLTGSGTTRLVAVKVRPEEVRFEEPEEERPAYVGTLGHLYLTAILAGIVRNVVEDASALVKRRVRSFAHAPAARPVDDPLLQETIGEISAAAFAAEATVLAAADALGRSADAVAESGHDRDLARDLAHAAALAAAKANIVTGYLDSAARATGQDGLHRHDRRYDQADEYLEVLYKLWEGSWADDAVRRDRAARVFAVPAKVRPVSHRGEFYRVEGYHLSEPSRQRTPVLYQAGTSPRGRRFAARHAECVFVSGRDKQATREAVQSIREQAAAAGRRPDDVKIVIGVSVVADRSRQAAEEKLAEYKRYASPEAALTHFSASTGIDFAKYDLDEVIPYGPTNAIQSAADHARQRGLTRRQLLSEMALGGRYPALAGDAASIADELESWIDETGIDGFNLTRTVTPESYEDFIDVVVPELQERGRFKTAYAEGSLRHKLFGEGDRLPSRHPVQAYRYPD